MRALLAVPWFFPDSVGGTEVYVRSLARQLSKVGVDVAIAAPAGDHRVGDYLHDGVRVFRFPDSNGSSGEIDLNRPEPLGWCDLLDTFAPTVVDLHSLTSGLELAHLRAAKRRGAHTVTTLHIPGIVCARGTFMRFGKVPCSGEIAREPCTACRLQAQGVPQTVGHLLARVPPRIAGGIGARLLPQLVRRAVAASLKDQDRRAWLDQIVHHSDRIVAPSKWLADVLLRNRVPRHKIVLCRQGVDTSHVTGEATRRQIQRLKIGFVGRYDPVKGLHVLIDAVRRMPPEINLEVHVWGVARSNADQSYRQAMVERAGGDPRIIFHDEAANAAGIYRQIDVLAVPSEWLETGPLVVLEAQAAGLPIVGSNVGGIAERVVDGEDGILVPVGDPGSLARALMSLAANPSLVDRLRPKGQPRTVADVASETLRTYETLAAADAA